jgi:hypothetical protein
MKKILASLGTIFGFFGLAMAAIFFMETTANTNYALPHGNLTADISANNTVDAVNAAPPDQSPDANANANPGTSTDAMTVSNPSTQASQADTSVSLPLRPEPKEASLPTLSAPMIAASTSIAPTYADNVPVISTAATATITVTPVAPLYLPSPQQKNPREPVSGGLALPYDESVFRGDHEWQITWGTMNTTWSDFMDLSAGAESTGGAVYLKNSANWTNYTMSAALDWVGGRTVGLMADYDDASNYVLCEYAKTDPGTITMRLLQYVNGNEVFLSPGAPISWDGGGSDLSLSIEVDGIYGTCSFNGQTISNNMIGPGTSVMNFQGIGGIGFTVSDPFPNASEIVVKHVSVIGE